MRGGNLVPGTRRHLQYRPEGPRHGIVIAQCRRRCLEVNDGYIRLDNAGEWVSAAQMPYWQQLPYPWIRLDWDEEVTLSRIVLYDRPTGDAHTAGGDLFSATVHVSE